MSSRSAAEKLTDKEWREMFERQGRKCARDGCGDTEGPFIADHSTPNVWKKGKPDWLICVHCDAIKTPNDISEIARVKRLNGTTGSQASRREERKAKGLPPLIAPRPFPGQARKMKPRMPHEILGARP